MKDKRNIPHEPKFLQKEGLRLLKMGENRNRGVQETGKTRHTRKLRRSGAE